MSATSYISVTNINPLTPNDPYRGRTAPLTSKRFILYIYSTNKGTGNFKHCIYSPFLSLQNAVCFIIITYLAPVLFTFYIRSALKLKQNNSGAKRLRYFMRGHGTLMWFWFYVIYINAIIIHVCSVEPRFECLLNELFVVNFVFGDPFTLTRRNWVQLVLYCSAGIQQLNRDQLRNRRRYFTINLLIYHTGALHQNVQGYRIYSIVTDIMCRRL